MLRIALLLLLCAYTSRVLAEDEHPLDARVNARIEKAVSTVEMVEAHDEGVRLWDAEMNRCFAVLKKKLKPGAFAKLQAAQRQWLAYRDAQYQFFREFYGKREGTMYIPMSAAAAMSLVRQRALDLYHALELIEENGE